MAKLFKAADEGDMFHVRKYLIEEDINYSNENGMTALSVASFRGNKGIAKLLIDKGANLDLQDFGGRTALICAIMGEHKDIAKLLIDKGANLDLQEDEGFTALMLGDMDLVKLLEDKGANLDLQNNEGNTALMLASYRGDKDIVKLLEDKMASPRSSPPSSSSDNWICAVFGALGYSFHHLCTRLADLPQCIKDTCTKEIDKKFDPAGQEIMKDF
jgi:serine/threonine-protein phosphatase 6 regulatory ankyrin repeat subunit B